MQNGLIQLCLVFAFVSGKPMWEVSSFLLKWETLAQQCALQQICHASHPVHPNVSDPNITIPLHIRRFLQPNSPYPSLLCFPIILSGSLSLDHFNL